MPILMISIFLSKHSFQVSPNPPIVVKKAGFGRGCSRFTNITHLGGMKQYKSMVIFSVIFEEFPLWSCIVLSFLFRVMWKLHPHRPEGRGAAESEFSTEAGTFSGSARCHWPGFRRRGGGLFWRVKGQLRGGINIPRTQMTDLFLMVNPP